MKTETIVLLGVATLAVGAGAYLYYQKKKATPAAADDRNNAGQRADLQGANKFTDAVNAGTDALDAIGRAFGGW